MSVIWNFPGPKTTAKMLVVAAVVGLAGLLVAGPLVAAKSAGGVFLAMSLVAWGWANMEYYTSS